MVLLTDVEDVLQQVSGVQARDAECPPSPSTRLLAKLRNVGAAGTAIRARLLNDNWGTTRCRAGQPQRLTASWPPSGGVPCNGEPLTLLLLDIGCTRTPSGQPKACAVAPVADSLSRRLQRPADTISHQGARPLACILPNTPWYMAWHWAMSCGPAWVRSGSWWPWRVNPGQEQEEADIRVGVACAPATAWAAWLACWRWPSPGWPGCLPAHARTWRGVVLP